jgi:predicted ATP-grasp superfamily ATP-dependent carboligase
MRLTEPRLAAGEAPASFGPVLVLDGWERMALGAVRGLGRRGAQVGMAGLDPSSEFTSASRYVRWKDPLPDPAGPGEPYERALGELVARRGYRVVVSCHDATLARLASIRMPVPTLARLDAPWHAVQDKIELAAIAEEVGVGYPRTEAVDTPEEAGDAFDRLGAPVYLKSRQSALAGPDAVSFQRGAVRAATRAEAQAAAAALQAQGLPVIVQAPVAGVTKFSAILLRRDGETELRYAMRFVREYPRTGGIGVTLDSIDAGSGDGAEVTRALERICERVGYHGIIQAELYRDADGRLNVIDVNPRLWGSVWFAERLGLRPLERSIRAALDLPALPPPAYRAGMRFHTLSSELRWVLRDPNVPAAALRYAAALRPADRLEWLDLSDPLPTARYVASGLRSALS